MHYFLHCVDLCSPCVQTLVISSAKVGWKKQGTCILVDNEPTPPKNKGYEADKGWKVVKKIQVVQGGGDFLFPLDQLLVCLANGYRVLENDKSRTLSNLDKGKNYLVWYHHLTPLKEWKSKKDGS